MYNKLVTSKTQVEEVFVRNNQIDDVGVNGLERIKDEKKSTIALDLLEKLKYL